MKNAICNPVNYHLDKELFTAGMRDTLLQIAPLSFFGPLVTILAPHLGQLINVVTHTVAALGEEEVMQAWEGVQSATERKGLKGPVKVTGPRYGLI